jgi:hypothetical protein
LEFVTVGMPILWVVAPILTKLSTMVTLQFTFEVSWLSWQAQYATMKGSTAVRAKPVVVMVTGNCK